MSQIALIWLWTKDISSPIIGATKMKCIDDAVDAFNIKFSTDAITYLEEMYVSHQLLVPINEKSSTRCCSFK